MTFKIKVSAVSYTNTKPFLYGFKLNPEIFQNMDLSLDIPSVCAEKLIQNQVDIGLVPVAALLELPWHELISEYCIGADGAVGSVFIFSRHALENINTIQLDPESKTSNLLAKVLLKFHWKKEITFTQMPCEAKVLIGDRSFSKDENYPFEYDLALEWKKFSQLPFVFAAWIANKKIDPDFIEIFNKSLKIGLENRKALLSELPPIVGFDVEDYLLHKIDYHLNAKKKEALALFLDYVKKLDS